MLRHPRRVRQLSVLHPLILSQVNDYGRPGTRHKIKKLVDWPVIEMNTPFIDRSLKLGSEIEAVPDRLER